MAIAYSVSTNIATVTAYTEAVPANFTDIYNADKAGTLSLHARTGIAGTDGAGVAVDRAERPADYIVLGSASNDLYITIANWNGTTATIRITGTDRDGAAQTEDIVVNANGTYYTTKWFKTITHTQVTAFTATSFDYDLTQGQWGVVWKQCTHKFCFDASIQFGDGSTTTWFKDTNKQILMKTGDITMYSTYKTSMYVKPLANVYFGEVQDATNKIGKNGCVVDYNYTNNYRKFGINVFGSGNLYLYASKFYGNQPYGFGSQYSSPVHTGNFVAWDCVFNKRIITTSANCDLNNVTVNLQNTVDVGLIGKGTLNKIVVFGVTTQGALYPYGGDMTVRDAYIRDCANIALLSSSSGGDLYIIDADTDVWTIYWHNANAYKVYRQYSFNLKVIDKDNAAINGATVKVWDKDSNLVVNTTTNASGVIAEQIVTRGHYDYTNNDVLQEKSPHLLEVRKSGTNFLTYTGKFTLDKKVSGKITMTDMTDLRNDIAALDTKIDVVQTDLDNPNQYKADVPTAVENAIAVWDRILTGATHNIATSAGRRVREIGAFAIHSGTAQAGNSHSITLAATADANDGVYNRNLIVLTDNTGVGQTRTIVDYDATSKVVVIDRDWRVSPDATTSYQIVPDDTPLTVDHGVARGGTNRTITIRAYASSVDDAYLCNIVTIIAGTGRGQARLVDSYDGTTKVVTICGDDWVDTPDTTSVYVMMPYGVACAACVGTEALNAITDGVWDEDLSNHTVVRTAGKIMQQIKSVVNAIFGEVS